MDVISATSCTRRALIARAVGCMALAGQSLQPILASDQVDNVARLLSDDSTSLVHRLMLIDQATSEVFISAYEVGDDLVALHILAKLREAARRGLYVRLLVDGHGTNNLIPKPLMAHLIEQGVQIREHQPDVRYKLEIGRQRMHDKLLIVDGQQLIIGGRNVRADYYGMAEQLNCHPEGEDRPPRSRWDREAYIKGPVVQCVRQYFLDRWQAGTSGQPTLQRAEKRKTLEAQQLEELNELPDHKARACAAKILDEALVAALPYSKRCCHEHSMACQCEQYFNLNCVRFLHDIPEHAKDCPNAIAHRLNTAISAARQSVLIESPYLVITRELRKRLIEIRRLGVDVCVLTNSLETNDQPITHAQYANERAWLVAAGIELWEMKGKRCLHAKSMVIDGYRTMIGSYNFDVLSETRNSETALLIDDQPFAAALTAQIAHHMLHAIPVDGPLRGFDARTNEVESEELRQIRIKRLISPWIKKYL